ncbi:MAG TPA: septum formation protein Maf [Planctomycetaceae bacterium]|nr:septum formation protein Maf [Planctomycetaceae bacterium]
MYNWSASPIGRLAISAGRWQVCTVFEWESLVNRPSYHLILASKSPRRRELLAEAGYDFTVVPADEEVESGAAFSLGPVELVRELAYRKAADVVSRLRSGGLSETPEFAAGGRPTVVLGCDTVVECDGAILGKPTDRDDARRMLERLRGRTHQVHSGLCLWPLSAESLTVDVATTTLRMDRLDADRIDEYLAGDGWEGKAGAFGYQDRTGWVHVVAGSESNVVGLPLELLADMLAKLG